MDTDEQITRNDDGSLTVVLGSDRAVEVDGELVPQGPTTVTLRPGEGGYDEALARWDHQQEPDRDAAVSTASGRETAMAVVHTVATDPDVDAGDAVDELDDPDESAEALRHVLVGGTPSVEGFAAEVAASEGGEPLPAHEVTKIIGEVLAEIDS